MPKRTSPSGEGGSQKKRKRLRSTPEPPPAPRFQSIEDVIAGLDNLSNIEIRVIYGEWNKFTPHHEEVAVSEKHGKKMRDLMEKAYPALMNSLRTAHDSLQKLVATLPESMEHNRELIERLLREDAGIDYRLDILTKNRVGLVASWRDSSEKYLQGLHILRARLEGTIHRCTSDASAATAQFQELRNNLGDGIARLRALPRAEDGATPIPASRRVTIEYKNKLRLLIAHYTSLRSTVEKHGMIDSLLSMQHELHHGMHYTRQDHSRQYEEFLHLIPLRDHVVPMLVLRTLIDSVRNDLLAESVWEPSHDFAGWLTHRPSAGLPCPLVVDADPASRNAAKESPYTTTFLLYTLVNVRSTKTRNHMNDYDEFCSAPKTRCFSPNRVQRWEILPTFWLYVTEHECDPSQMTIEALINGCQNIHILFENGISSRWRCFHNYAKRHGAVPAGIALNQSGHKTPLLYSGVPPSEWIKGVYSQASPVTLPRVPTGAWELAFRPVSHAPGVTYPLSMQDHIFYSDMYEPSATYPPFRADEEITGLRISQMCDMQIAMLVNQHPGVRLVSSANRHGSTGAIERVVLSDPCSRYTITLGELPADTVAHFFAPCMETPQEYCLTSFRGYFTYDEALTGALSDYNTRLPAHVETLRGSRLHGCFFSPNSYTVDVVGLMALLARMGETCIDRLPANFLDHCISVPHISDEFLLDIVAACMTNPGGLTIREVRGSRGVCHHVLREVCTRIEAIAGLEFHANHQTCLSFADAEFIYFFRQADACTSLTLARVLEALTQGPLLHALFRGRNRLKQAGTSMWATHMHRVVEHFEKRMPGANKKHDIKIPESFMSILTEPTDQELEEFVQSLPVCAFGALPTHTFQFHVRQNRTADAFSPSAGKGVLHTALAGFFYHLNRYMLQHARRPGCLYFTTRDSPWSPDIWMTILALLAHGVLKGADVSLAIHPAEFFAFIDNFPGTEKTCMSTDRFHYILVAKLERIYPMAEGAVCNRAPTHYHPGEDLERALTHDADAHLEASVLHRYGLRVGRGMISWFRIFPTESIWLTHRFFCAPNPRTTFTSQAVAHALAPVNFAEDSVTVACVRRWVEGLSPEALRVFCFFATGKRSPPSSSTITLSREHPNYARFDKLPIATTCSAVISLPDYDTLKPEGCSLEDLEAHIGAKFALAIHSGDMALD